MNILLTYILLVCVFFNLCSRGDTREFSDLNKLARRFLKGNQNSVEGEVKDLPSKAYIQEVVEDLRKGEQGECPICLEAFEDAVLTPCAHRLCRECLLASWRNATSGLCPVCRYLQVMSFFQYGFGCEFILQSQVYVILALPSY